LDELESRAYELLLPLVKKRLPHAQFLYACYLASRESESEEDYFRRYAELVRDAAQAGHAQAQFTLGQLYDRGGELGHDAEVSAYWFRLSAEQGDAYAEWVHGLNLLGGEGLPRDMALGLKFIEQSAAKKFEGALQFLAEAYSEGRYGYPIDAKRAECLRKQLLDDDVIGF
jgi:hypothetical protein